MSTDTDKHPWGQNHPQWRATIEFYKVVGNLNGYKNHPSFSLFCFSFKSLLIFSLLLPLSTWDL